MPQFVISAMYSGRIEDALSELGRWGGRHPRPAFEANLAWATKAKNVAFSRTFSGLGLPGNANLLIGADCPGKMRIRRGSAPIRRLAFPGVLFGSGQKAALSYDMPPLGAETPVHRGKSH